MAALWIINFNYRKYFKPGYRSTPPVHVPSVQVPHVRPNKRCEPWENIQSEKEQTEMKTRIKKFVTGPFHACPLLVSQLHSTYFLERSREPVTFWEHSKNLPNNETYLKGYVTVAIIEVRWETVSHSVGLNAENKYRSDLFKITSGNW